MKRSERRLLEEKLRYVALEDVELDPAREQQMLEQLKAEFLQRGAETGAKRSGGHGIGRRVLIVSAAAILFVILSFGFTVFMPESVTHAKGFVRSAAIWVNNTFHLGYEFEEPMEHTAESHEQDAEYSTLEEAAANIPYPLVYLDDPNFELQSVARNFTVFGDRITINYISEEQSIIISQFSANEDTIATADSAAITIPWENGQMICWEINSMNCALVYFSGMEIFINGNNMSFDTFLDICQNLKSFN